MDNERSMGVSPELHQEHSTILNLSHLENLLLLHGMNTSEWGKDTAKSIKDLYFESQDKESNIVFENDKIHIFRMGSGKKTFDFT